jgi:hypothetical protein
LLRFFAKDFLVGTEVVLKVGFFADFVFFDLELLGNDVA